MFDRNMKLSSGVGMRTIPCFDPASSAGSRISTIFIIRLSAGLASGHAFVLLPGVAGRHCDVDALEHPVEALSTVNAGTR